MTEKTFGQIAYEAMSEEMQPFYTPWPELVNQRGWEAAGKAVAERCAEIAGFFGVEEDALDKFDWGKGYCAGGNSAALAIRNFIDQKDVLGATIETASPAKSTGPSQHSRRLNEAQRCGQKIAHNKRKRPDEDQSSRSY